MIKWLRKKLFRDTFSPEVADFVYESAVNAYEQVRMVLDDLEAVPEEERDEKWLLDIARLARVEAELYYALLTMLEDSEAGLAALKELNPERY